jgi:hypothetical protein
LLYLNKYNLILNSSIDGTLELINYLNGNKKLYNNDNSDCKLDGQLFSNPILINKYLYIGCRDNYLYCFEIKNEYQ